MDEIRDFADLMVEGSGISDGFYVMECMRLGSLSGVN